MVMHETSTALPGIDDFSGDRGEIERSTLQAHFSAGHPSDFQKIVDKARHVLDLTRQNVTDLLQYLRLVCRDLEKLSDVRHRRERIAELVCEHRQKLVFRPIRGAQ